MSYRVEYAIPETGQAFTLDHPVLGVLDAGNTLDAGDVWHDITDSVRSVMIVRGRTSPLDDVDVGELRIVCNNHDRRWDPHNQLSDLYGGLRPGMSVRVWWTAWGDRLLATGRVRDFDATRDASGDAVTVIRALDRLGSLASALLDEHTPPAETVSERIVRVLDRSEVNFGSARDIEGSDIDLGTEPLSGSALSTLSDAVLAEQGRLFVDRSDVLTFRARAGYRGAGPSACFGSAPHVWWQTPGATASCTIPSGTGPLAPSAASDFSVHLDVQLIGTMSEVDNTHLLRKGNVAHTVHDYRLLVDRTGTTLDWYLQIGGSVAGPLGDAALSAAVLAGRRVQLDVNFDRDNGAGASDWWLNYRVVDGWPTYDLVDGHGVAWVWTGAAAGAHSSFGGIVSIGTTGTVFQLGDATGAAPSQWHWWRVVLRHNRFGIAQQTPAADWVMAAEPYGSVTLHDRSGNINHLSLSSGSVGYGNNVPIIAPYAKLEFSHGGDEWYTRVAVERDGGAVATLATVEDATTWGTGHRTLQVTVPLATDAQTADLANFLLDRYHDPGIMFRSVTFLVSGAERWTETVLSVEIGDVVRVEFVDTRAGEPATLIQDCVVEGISEEIEASGAHQITFALSPHDSSMPFVLDDPVYGRLDHGYTLTY